jgi:hypothetical protein
MPASPNWCLPAAANAHPIPRDGRRHTGVLERILRRQWDPNAGPPPEAIVHAIDDLAELPVHIATRLAENFDAIWIGEGSVCDLDDLGYLHGQPVRPGDPASPTWDLVPGLCTPRMIAIGTRDHLSASLVHHEVGHGLDLLDRMSDREDWATIMMLVREHLTHPRYLDPAEWWAEAYALCATRQASRLLRVLNGQNNLAAIVWTYFRRMYGV